MKIALPGASACTVPTTDFGEGDTTPSPPQPASASTAVAQKRVKAPRRMGRESTDSNRSRPKQPSAPRPITSTGVSLTTNDTASATIIASTPIRRGLLVPIQTSAASDARKKTMLYAD